MVVFVLLMLCAGCCASSDLFCIYIAGIGTCARVTPRHRYSVVRGSRVPMNLGSRQTTSNALVTPQSYNLQCFYIYHDYLVIMKTV